MYAAALWFRGKQVSDSNGIVVFDTCYPGWYQSRTIHIHFIVTVDGTSTLTSQFVFDDTLNDDVIGSQPIDRDRGARDTTNKDDNVIPADQIAAYAFSTQRMTDGALLAYKTIVVRLDPSAKLCSIGGDGGPPGGDGPHGHGPPPHRPGGGPPDFVPLF